MTSEHRLGLDLGSVFIKAVLLDEAHIVRDSWYRPHRGDPARELSVLLNELDAADRLATVTHVGLTGASAAACGGALGLPAINLERCQARGVQTSIGRVTAVMDVGGASSTLLRLDDHGAIQGITTNSLCAAGTGAFLDEQAGRLGLSYDDVGAFAPVKDPPTIATRCAVFAKSDLIHRQQEGCSKEAMWSGLCRGMTRTLLNTLLCGQPLDGVTALIGGVAQNKDMVYWLEAAVPGRFVVPPEPHLQGAIGAALLASPLERPLNPTALAQDPGPADLDRYPWALTMERSTYPSFAVAESYQDVAGNEVRVTRWAPGEHLAAYLGIDIGSTSTKLALIDESGAVLVDVYRKTSGDPIGATGRILRALSELVDRTACRLEILGTGTTGSGRKIVGAVSGADAVVNEISAHVMGATRVDPGIDTIFEIGGQDAKYMHVVDGHIRHANMNYVCAAGTGSFVEEQANKLGYRVADVGQAVQGIYPPRASDRCTVFMEGDVARLVQGGATREDALAAVMVSVVKNYLNKVVGNRPRSRTRIFFQGATARNPALVAAFEHVLDVPVVVSPYCHVMGAYGVALIVRREMQEHPRASRFRGLDLDRQRIELRDETCHLCHNDCRITVAAVEGVAEHPSWGYQCGREPDDTRVRVSPNDRLLRQRQSMWREAGSGVAVPTHAPVVGLPQALMMYTYLPLWRRFFNRLGFAVKLSGATTEATRDRGTHMAGAEFCFPAKVAIGHVAQLVEDAGIDWVCVPQMVSEAVDPRLTGAFVCPYVQGLSIYSRSALQLTGVGTERMFSPVIDFRREESRIVSELLASMGQALGRNRRQIRAAWRDAVAVQRDFDARCRATGMRALAEARERGESMTVLTGRPYNLYDRGLNLDLPRKLADQGSTLLPVDMMDLDLSRILPRYRNTYWLSSAAILAALAETAASPDLDPVHLTNFNCGPDSFLLSFAEDIMGTRPLLALELDEHGSDTGYQTRIEAFSDVLSRAPARQLTILPSRPEPDEFRTRTIWCPSMHPIGTELNVAALVHHGYQARALPPEDQSSFEVGRRVTRGSECLPAAATIGRFLQTMADVGHEGRHALLMPTATGPCRFGQYCVLDRQILDREGYTDVALLSPSSANSYSGLGRDVQQTFWKSMVAADVLMKAGCRVRPYEVTPGETDRVVAREVTRLADVLRVGGDLEAELKTSVAHLAAIPVRTVARRPMVGIVGELFVRSNVFASEDVIHAVERFGGEAWMVPCGEWMLWVASPTNKREHHPAWSKTALRAYPTSWWMQHWEHRLTRAAGPLLSDRHEPSVEAVVALGRKWMPSNVGGEAVLTIGRTVVFKEQGAAAVVNCAPFGCMPGAVASAVFRQLSLELGMPVVNMFYDGTGMQNRRLEAVLKAALATAGA